MRQIPSNGSNSVGLGLGLVYSPSVSVVGLYFRRKRPYALGLTVTGAALGPIILPPLFRWCMELYSWRGVFALLAAFTMQCCVFGALLLPVKYIIKKPLCSQSSEHGRSTFTWKEISNCSIVHNPTFCVQIFNNLLWSVAISQLWIL